MRPPPVATPPTPNDTGTRDAEERTLAPWEYEPQKAVLVAEPPTGERWLHEIKLDGFRMGVLVGGRSKSREVVIISRNGTDYTAAFPEIAEAAMELLARAAVLDGEVVVLDERGRSSFQLLQQLGTSRRGLAFFAFDLLALDRDDLKHCRWRSASAGWKHSSASARASSAIRPTSKGTAGQCPPTRAASARRGSSASVARPPTGPGRSEDWRKTKCVRRQEFVVGGFTEPEGAREGVGSVLVGYYEGRAVRFAGEVGTGRGWNDTFGRKLRARLESIAVDTAPFNPPPPGALARRVHWAEPRLVAEVQFTEWTGDGKIRHPSLQGFRTDRRPADVRREREAESTN